MQSNRRATHPSRLRLMWRRAIRLKICKGSRRLTSLCCLGGSAARKPASWVTSDDPCDSMPVPKVSQLTSNVTRWYWRPAACFAAVGALCRPCDCKRSKLAWVVNQHCTRFTNDNWGTNIRCQSCPGGRRNVAMPQGAKLVLVCTRIIENGTTRRGALAPSPTHIKAHLSVCSLCYRYAIKW